jgi:uncharacterized surface protein with fasciclin (FAS1) repeats
MFRKFTVIAILITLVIAAALPVATPRAEAQDNSIVDIAVADGRFTTLVAALQATGLDAALAGPGPFTVFAPTDAAFGAVLDLLDITAADLLADEDLLTQILLYHVVPGAVTSGQVAGIDSAETLQGSALNFSAGGPLGVKVNGEINVIIADIQASNGVIHVIDGVLFPPQNILGLAADNNLTIFLEALDAAGLTAALFGGPYTVLAPTNDAFVEALGALGLTKDELFANTDLLRSVLLYHVIPGAYTSDVVVTLNSAPTLNGTPISINGTTFNGGQASVYLPDLKASNGVLHIIDGVLLP